MHGFIADTEPEEELIQPLLLDKQYPSFISIECIIHNISIIHACAAARVYIRFTSHALSSCVSLPSCDCEKRKN